jgi:hypothetical protein
MSNNYGAEGFQKFDGKLYELKKVVKTKREAADVAGKARDGGKLARVTKKNIKEYPWAIWTRKKM